jgi:hypothetical protein
MAKRVLLTAVLGGLAMFFWLFIAHMLTPLGMTGLRDIPNEETVRTALGTNIAEPGMYVIPGLGIKPGASRDEMNAAMQRAADKELNGPSGILIYHPRGVKALTPGQLLTELGNNILQALFAAILLSFAAARLTSYISRVGFVALAGLMAGITTNVSYWNWYGFPTSYTVAYAFTEIMGYVCIGLVAAAIIKNGTAAAMKAAA